MTSWVRNGETHGLYFYLAILLKLGEPISLCKILEWQHHRRWIVRSNEINIVFANMHRRIPLFFFFKRALITTLLALCSSLSLRGVPSEKPLGRPFLSDAIDDLFCPCDSNFRTFWFDIVSQMVENNNVRGCFFIVEDGFLVSAIVYDSFLNGEESSGSIVLVLDIPISRIFGLRVLDFGESWFDFKGSISYVDFSSVLFFNLCILLIVGFHARDMH